VDDSRGLVLTADARIDNREELIVALGFGGRPREEVTDSELILGAYKKWGERCPERLFGDFAFAVWDRGRRNLFCARDHRGVKPFYYYRSAGTLVFASEIKALLRVPGVPRRLNEVRVADYLVPILEDKAITFYQDILRLPPAHSMTVTHERVSIRSYWSLDPSREVRFRSNEEYAEAFRELFTEAVRCRLRSAFPVGSLLSGGLDSSSIVCVARELLAKKGDQQLHTFSAVFPDVPQSDESVFMDTVLAQGGLEPHRVRADLLSPLYELDRVMWHEDEATWSPNLYMHWGLYRSACQQGVHILLDGDGGDQTTSHGIEYLPELARLGRWKTLATEIHGFSTRYGYSPWYVLWRYTLRPLAPEFAQRVWRAARRLKQPPWCGPYTIIAPDFARHLGLEERARALNEGRSRSVRNPRENHWSMLTSGVYSYQREVFDKAAAAFSIEPRYPFDDVRLAEFCLALPPEQKLNGGWTRVVMRRGLTNSLPEKIRWRGTKGDLSHSFDRNLLALNRGLLEEVIFGDLQVIDKYVDMTALREAYRKYASQGVLEESYRVYAAVTLALWLAREVQAHSQPIQRW
jgi:asparagine synthase (glutamine-hydrolysing)